MKVIWSHTLEFKTGSKNPDTPERVSICRERLDIGPMVASRAFT